MRTRTLIALTAFLSLFSCTTEPQTSYCEAVCDWAVGCAEGERTVDAAALTTECLAATEAVDASCADAGKGELNAVDAKALTACTDEVQAAVDAGECDGFTGRIDDQKQATAPAKCIALQGGTTAQDTYDAARLAVAETNEELCERFADAMCSKTASCVEESLGADFAAALEAVGQDPYDNCRAKVQSNYSACVADGDYTPEADITDVNSLRQGARECLADFTEVTCDQLFGGSMPPLCAAAVADPTAYAGSIGSVLTDYTDAATE